MTVLEVADSSLVLLTVEEAARRLRIGRTTCFRLLAGELESVTVGRLRRVPAGQGDSRHWARWKCAYGR
jgi:excisionase family DNA binding protein